MLVLTTGGLCLLAPQLAAGRGAGGGPQPPLGLRPAAHDPVPLLDRRGRRMAVAGAVGAALSRPSLDLARLGGGGRLPARRSQPPVGGRDRTADPGRVAAPGRPAGDPRCDPRRGRAWPPRCSRSRTSPSGASSSSRSRSRGPRREGVGRSERERATGELDYIVFDPGMRFWGAPSVQQVGRDRAARVRRGHAARRRGPYGREPA